MGIPALADKQIIEADQFKIFQVDIRRILDHLNMKPEKGSKIYDGIGRDGIWRTCKFEGATGIIFFDGQPKNFSGFMPKDCYGSVQYGDFSRGMFDMNIKDSSDG